jgi:hypothetical protein
MPVLGVVVMSLYVQRGALHGSALPPICKYKSFRKCDCIYSIGTVHGVRKRYVERVRVTYRKLSKIIKPKEELFVLDFIQRK